MISDSFYQDFKQGRTLVIGSKVYSKNTDRRRLYPDAIGLDLFDGDGVDIVHDLETPLIGYGLFDHIDCYSVLEHVQRPWLMCANIESVMGEGSTIFISVPFIWRVHGYPSDYWRITKDALPILFPRIEWIKRGYLAGETLHKKSPATTIDGQVYIQKTEVVGFGVKRGL